MCQGSYNLSAVLHHFVLAELATSSIRVIMESQRGSPCVVVPEEGGRILEKFLERGIGAVEVRLGSEQQVPLQEKLNVRGRRRVLVETRLLHLVGEMGVRTKPRTGISTYSIWWWRSQLKNNETAKRLE